MLNRMINITNRILESNGPKVDHCGTPDAIFKEEEILQIGEQCWWVPIRTNVTTG
jgi:hypothetical protein